MKRLRKQLAKEGYKDPLKYYLVGEYGGETERPHYHAILYNLPEKYQVNEHKIQKLWGHGHVRHDEVNGKSISYVCGYVNKQKHFSNFGELDDRIPEFNFMSKGLGKSYLTDQQIKSMKEKLRPYLTFENGQKLTMPRYFKEKVFTLEEKEILQESSKLHLEKNVIFDNEIDKIEYIKNQTRIKQLLSKTRNKL